MSPLTKIRTDIRKLELCNEEQLLTRLQNQSPISNHQRTAFSQRAISIIKDIRADDQPGLMEVFLAEYGLSTDEGVALMCLAEALLRVPDSETIDDLIEDKIAPSSWGVHLGKSSSSLVNASTWALMLTGKVLDTDHSAGVAGVLHGAVKRLGEPVIRVAVKSAMKEMGNQFVLGETIDEAIARGASSQKQGFTYSYDMLGEAALTAKDALGFYQAYEASIKRLKQDAKSEDIRNNPGISIKLSALHPRYEVGQKARVMDELVERTLALTLQAKDANIGLNIDAEEADRLDISLDIIEAVLSDARLEGWDGFGVVVQAYSKRATGVIDWLYALAEKLDRKIMVRLVKGAYWDTEVKRAQVEGLKDYPVFTRKAATDVSYILCAEKLLKLTDRIYPQFATHNAHSVAAILELASEQTPFEFQRLHGMGAVMHRQVLEDQGTRCRIYAPVGAHRDLLAYLVRRLLENGANSSFVNQIVDETVAPEEIASDPFETLDSQIKAHAFTLRKPAEIYAPNRDNSKGWDLHSETDITNIEQAREPFQHHRWTARPLLAKPFSGDVVSDVTNPANPHDVVGTVIDASKKDVRSAITNNEPWNIPASIRAVTLNKAADLFEENFGELFALLSREAGKITQDAIAELREAVDFLRYYAFQATKLTGNDRSPRGLISCISPWNFPLAIFTGQVAAALAAGNSVLAKPAETTPLIAMRAVELLHLAGVPKAALQLLPGEGRKVGAEMVSNPSINGVCFTGSTATAQIINRAMAETVDPNAPLIAETGGLNAMVVDSTALPEQAVKDIIASAFQSAGQRCSALRLLYLQSDIAETFMEMLFGAMDEQRLGNPWHLATDIGPIIDGKARQEILEHIETARTEGRLLKQLPAPESGYFVGPAVISVSGMRDMEKEVFGPVLHIATFKAHELDRIISEINESGYGLTFGLHTRIDQRVEHLTRQLKVGNIYVNRNQIGAVVGSQPFGGEGLSGTGPKAGGPHYVKRFTTSLTPSNTPLHAASNVQARTVQTVIDKIKPRLNSALETLELPGPTGESNRLSLHPKGTVLCLGPGLENAQAQADIATSRGCGSILICAKANGSNAVDGILDPEALRELTSFSGVAYWAADEYAKQLRRALAARNGEILPLIDQSDMADRCVLERHICIDTTASGGNVALLSGM